jgi:hypothetical protein
MSGSAPFTPRLIAGEQMRRRSPSRLILEIDIGERIAVRVPDDETVQWQALAKQWLSLAEHAEQYPEAFSDDA